MTHTSCSSLQGEWQDQSTHRACGHEQSLQGEWQGQNTHSGLVGVAISAGEWQSQLTHTSGIPGMTIRCLDTI